MGKSFTLQSFKDEVDKKYGPMVLSGFPGEGGDIRLLPLLRHSESRRAEISTALSSLQDAQKSTQAVIAAVNDPGAEVPVDAPSVDLNGTIRQVEELVTLVLERKSDIARIKDGIGDDGQAMLELWSQYQEDTKPGEAEPLAS